MANLRDYLYGYAEGGQETPQEVVVYNTNYKTVNNGGQCCVYSVPANMTQVVGEVIGGGGAGTGSQCCGYGYPAGGGGTMEFSGPVEPGDAITICAAGSTCCRSYNSCQNGSNSFVCNPGKWCVIACGGLYGEYLCNGFTCQTTRNSCCITPGSVTGSAVSVAAINREPGYIFGVPWCANFTYQVAQGAGQSGHIRSFYHGCCLNRYAGTCYFGTFPGGGGGSASSTGGSCYCGAPGAGGMVYLVFK